jgi:iron complex transport system permease protein
MILRLPRVGVSARVPTRAVAVIAVVLAGSAGVLVWSLTVGDVPVPVGDVLAVLLGDDPGGAGRVVQSLRLPRGLTAVGAGAAFGLSGAIFQRITGNPLASPDVIGITWGAAAAAVGAVVLLDAGGTTVSLYALAGGVVTALAVYLLAYRQGVTGYRLVLVGIGLSAVCTAVTSYLLTRSDLYEARQAVVWLTGSLGDRDWDHARPLGVALALLVPVAAGLARPLRLLELGDDTARGLGARVELSRAALLLTGTALAAVATASTGPVGFAALVSPQIARRLVGGRSLALLPAAACGALLLVTADLVGRRVVAPTELPVGVVTSLVGAPFLLVLLARANRIGSGG